MGNYKIYEDHLLTCESRWNIGKSWENHWKIIGTFPIHGGFRLESHL